MSTKLEWKTQHLDGHAIDSSVTPAEAKCLRSLARNHNVLEIGAAYGYSTIVMAQKARQVTSVDPHVGELPNSYETMLQNLDLFGITNVEILRMFSQEALPILRYQGQQYDTIFVDGNHDVQVENDIALSLWLLKAGGHLTVHDYGQYDFPEITRVCDAVGPPLKVVDSLWVYRK